MAVADQFRDGNVPAVQDPLSVAQRAFEALPETVEEFYFRGDSACYENLDWLRDENREKGPPGRIGFAVSAPLTRPKRAVVEVPDEAWQTYRDDPEVDIDAPLEYYPGAPRADDYREPLRYLAIRVKKKQAELFADGSAAVLCSGDEYMGLAAAAAAGVASGEAGIDRGAARCAQERVGGGRDALRPLRGQCRLAAAERADAQRADGDEATGAAAGITTGTTEAAAVFGFPGAGQAGASCTTGAAAAAARGGAFRTGNGRWSNCRCQPPSEALPCDDKPCFGILLRSQGRRMSGRSW